MGTYNVYILASPTRALYVGVAGDMERRLWQHKAGSIPGFTSRYGITRLVHLEEYGDIRDAIAREKQIKGWRGEKKVALIEETNPTWRDLSVAWFRESRGENS